jgi:hypothetical protein
MTKLKLTIKLKSENYLFNNLPYNLLLNYTDILTKKI